MSIGENIAKLRKNAGLTQEALAEKLNISGQAISKWENDLSFPDVEMLTRLSGLFGCTLDEVVHGKPGSPKIKSNSPEDIDRRVLTIIADDIRNDEPEKVYIHFPIKLIRITLENDSLKELMGENADLVRSISGMIFSGVTGELLNVESNGSKVVIRVEDYES